MTYIRNLETNHIITENFKKISDFKYCIIILLHMQMHKVHSHASTVELFIELRTYVVIVWVSFITWCLITVPPVLF